MGLICCKNKKHLYERVPNEENENIVTIPSTFSRHYIDDIDNNEKIGSFTLIWLDKYSKENSLDSLRTRTLLREINSDKNCLFYNDPKLFLNDINEIIHNENKILLIISGSYVEQILSTSIDIENIISIIIIFCKISDNYEKFLGKSNVTSICTDYDSLKTNIIRELPSLKFNLFQNRNFKTIQSLTTKLNSSSIQNYDNIGAYFSYKLFVELLKEIPHTDQAKENMLKQCKDFYRHNKQEQEKIKLFHEDYCSSKAIQWYTYNSFVYRLVNRAFRTEDTALWYLFRFYITDLCKQMEEVHKEQAINESYILYRGQPLLPTKEFDNIKTNIDGLISTNGFFSTSKSFRQALQFVQGAQDTEDFKAVMFEIRLNSNELKNTIFVDVDKHLKRDGEEEILFDIGTVFKIDNIEKNDGEEFWTIKVTVTDQGTTEIKQQINSMKKKFQRGNVNLLFGRLLLDMGQYTKANAYFQMMLQVLPPKHPDLSSIHDYIGDLKMRTTDYYNALTHFQLAYNLKRKRLSSNHPDLGITYNHFGNYYKAIGDITQADLYYKKSLKCRNSLINIAITKLNIGITCMMNNQYDQAREWSLQARDILQKIQPRPHTEIIIYRAVMGDIFYREEEYDECEAYYSLAFDLCKKFLSIGDLHRTRCINALADLYEKQDGNSNRALDFCFEQLSIHEQYLSDKNHISIGYIQMKIGQLSNNKNFYRKALDIFENNIHQEYVSLSDCQIKLASYTEYDQAIQLYTIANEIHKKIYPPNHSIILDSEQKLIKLKMNKNILTNLITQNQLSDIDLHQQVAHVDNNHEDVQILPIVEDQHLDHQSTVDDFMICNLFSKDITIDHKEMKLSTFLDFDRSSQIHIEIIRPILS